MRVEEPKRMGYRAATEKRTMQSAIIWQFTVYIQSLQPCSVAYTNPTVAFRLEKSPSRFLQHNYNKNA